MKDNKKAKLVSTFLTFSILIIMCFLIFSNYRVDKKRKELSLKTQELKQEIAELEAKHNEFKDDIIDSEQQDYLEAKIRDQGYQKPGETMVIIKTEEQGGKEEAVKPSSFLEEILSKIKKVF